MNLLIGENGHSLVCAKSDEINWIFDMQPLQTMQAFHKIGDGHRPPLQSMLIWLAA